MPRLRTWANNQKISYLEFVVVVSAIYALIEVTHRLKEK
jgi:hypothetical protein